MNDNYTTFAQLYDGLFDPSLYTAWHDWVVAQHQSYDGDVLDLGGGAGRLAVLLADSGYRVDVLDLSEQMLELAYQHAQAAEVDINLLQADMRDFSTWEKQYGLITSFADALNYLPTLSDLQTTFQQVHAHLADGGQFLFDVITPWQVNVGYDQYHYNNDEDPENMFMWTSFPGEAANSVDHDLKFFVYDDSIDGFKLIREVHHEQTYEQAVYVQALQAAGFRDIRVTADFGQRAARDDDDRWFFQAWK